MISCEKNIKILFQGDSITDCDRKRNDFYDLGNGYPRYIAEYLRNEYPSISFTFINKGISGDRSIDLVNRWHKDCIDVSPDIVSIMIGINDTWRRYDEGNITTAEEYENNYRKLLTEIKKELDISVILLEPFVLEVTPDRKQWREDLDPKIHIVRRLAREFNCILVPMDGLMVAEACRINMTELSADGVHPVEEGKKLIAKAWIKAAKPLFNELSYVGNI